tara:strand:+ start:19102 stop:19665 length:564 start_codon:yes stop_codon:yes gene_type:complete
MKFLIIGLGNPGEKYIKTRHNIGFLVLDNLAKNFESSFHQEKLGEVCRISNRGKKLILLKPSTFMNLSGKSVNYWMQKENIKSENILVITDDLAIPFGSIRMRAKGSDGGHNGLRDIINILNSKIFARIKFGIGSDFSKGNQSNYVLSLWSDEEFIQLEEKIEYIIKMVVSFTVSGINRTMNDFNKN